MIYRGSGRDRSLPLCRIYFSLMGCQAPPPSSLFLCWSAASPACLCTLSSSKGQSRSRWQHATGQTQWLEGPAEGGKVASDSRRWPGRCGLPRLHLAFIGERSLLKRIIQPLVENRNVAHSAGHGAGMGVRPPKRHRNDLWSLNKAPGVMGTRIGNYTSPTITPNPYPLVLPPTGLFQEAMALNPGDQRLRTEGRS